MRFREELDRGTELAKIAATPLTEAQLKADILKRQPEAFQALTVAPTRAQFEGGSLAQLFAGGDDLTRFNDRQAAALDIEPKNPPNVSVLQYDLNGQSGTVRADDQETINRIIAEATGKTIEQVEHDTDRDYYLNAQEGVNYGIIDHVSTTV